MFTAYIFAENTHKEEIAQKCNDLGISLNIAFDRLTGPTPSESELRIRQTNLKIIAKTPAVSLSEWDRIRRAFSEYRLEEDLDTLKSVHRDKKNNTITEHYYRDRLIYRV